MSYKCSEDLLKLRTPRRHRELRDLHWLLQILGETELQIHMDR